jgi:orotidine-5'-phosphate decarboxylase
LFLMLCLSACDRAGQGNDVSVQTAALTTAAPSVSGEAKARQDQSQRDSLRKNIETLKAQVRAGGMDAATEANAIAQIRAARDTFASMVPGAGGVPAAAQGSAAPAFQAAKYDHLRTLMSGYDMKKPADVAAWAALKRKELDGVDGSQTGGGAQ